jgi:DNA-binding NtrC family response regulator
VAHILVIDDESVLLDLISRTLRHDGHTVTTASDPIAAMESSSGRKQPIDLLLTDVDMRPINGFELVRRLTRMGFNAPVLFMSGYPDLASAMACCTDPYSFIDKPFTIDQLRVVVSRILANHARKCAG